MFFGIGFEKFWCREKYRYWFRKNLVSEKVLVLVSKNFGIKKSIGIGFGIKKIGIGKKFWIRFLSYFCFHHTLLAIFLCEYNTETPWL